MEIEDKANNIQASKTASKINDLNAIFEQAETVCSDDVIDFIEEKQQNINELTENGKKDIVVDGEVLVSRADVIKLQIMVDDYKEARGVLLENIRNGHKIAETVTLEIMSSDEDSASDKISSYATLINAINQSVKILAASYKDISTVLLNLDRLDKGKDPNVIVKGDVTINNTQHNQVISTTDMISQLKQLKDNNDTNN